MSTPNNLPRENAGFVNREAELRLLSDYVFSRDLRFICISGEGGVGKTSLALRFAHECERTKNDFTAIVWTTFKQFELVSQTRLQNLLSPTPKRINTIAQRTEEGVFVDSLADILETIFNVASYTPGPDIDITDALAWLRHQKLLLFIDDFDSWRDFGILVKFIEQIPPPNHVVFTSRRSIDTDFLPGLANLKLRHLSNIDSHKLLRESSQKHGFKLSKTELNRVSRFAEGNPLAINLVSSLVKHKLQRLDFQSLLSYFNIGPAKTVNSVLNDVFKEITSNDEVKEFLFSNLYGSLTNPQKNLLLEIAAASEILHGKEIPIAVLKRLSSIDSSQFGELLEELETSSLIRRQGSKIDINKSLSSFVLSLSDSYKIANEIRAKLRV